MKIIALMALAIFSFSVQANILYPMAPKHAQIEMRFGEVIVDEYKWMENMHDPKLWDWIGEQHALTRSMISEALVSDFYTEIKKYNDLASAQKKSEEAEAVKEEKKVGYAPLDPLLKEEGKEEELETEKYFTQTESIYGGDFSRMKIFKTEDKSLVDIVMLKFGREIKIEGEFLYYQSDADERLGGGTSAIYKHKIGGNQGDDKVIYKAAKSDNSVGIRQVEDKYYVTETTMYDITQTIFELNLHNGHVSNKRSFEGSIVGTTKDKKHFYVLDTKNSNNGEIYTYRIRDAVRELLIPEQDFNIESVIPAGLDKLLVMGHKDAESVVYTFDLQTQALNKIALPRGGRIAYEGVEETYAADEVTVEKSVTKFSFSSLETPKQKYEYDNLTDTLSLKVEHSYPITLAAKKLTYESATDSGQEAALWLVSKEGVELNESTPMIIYGYGGFDVTILPSFGFAKNLPWLEKGGAFAIVSLPGSLTYGREWNDAAKKGKRVVAWDSFAAAGKKLIELGLTSSDHLGMMGGSNGGLLVSGTLQRHADLFKAAVPMVGVHDLLNFNLFTAGKYWTWEYGNPFLEEDFREVYPISPYHNLTAKEYPAVLVTTAEFDDRVSAWHSYKYAAKLQEMQTGSAPVMLYNGEWQGHSSRSGSENNQLNLMASIYAFFAQELGL